MTADADVAVVGAGPVGSALALMLGRAGLRTLVLERARFPRDKPCGEGLMPAGARVLEELGVQLDGLPALRGVSYRLPGSGGIDGTFVSGGCGRGARRLVFDQLLAERAAAAPNVSVVVECAARGVETREDRVRIATTNGDVEARYLVGADGLRSRVARWMGWARPPRGPARYGLVGHLQAPGHSFDRITVTLLDGCEVYLAPTAEDEVLAAVLGPKTGLRSPGESVPGAYARRVVAAHPELSASPATPIRGAGPFWSRPSTRASGRVFLVGDAAGFLDPLTGDGITAGLLAARQLSAVLAGGSARAGEAYSRWESGQWRRRRLMSRLALGLTGSSSLARRALDGLTRRPAALDRLLEVNDGSRSPLALPITDWAALAGI
jgi:flavin-dependent dehydrogenase